MKRRCIDINLDITSIIPNNLIPVFDKVLKVKRSDNSAYKKSLSSLRESIEETKAEMNFAIDNFNNVTEPKLIDFYIYKIQAEQNKYDQLLCEYKTLESRNT